LSKRELGFAGSSLAKKSSTLDRMIVLLAMIFLPFGMYL
jgi:hypothetical protein